MPYLNLDNKISDHNPVIWNIIESVEEISSNIYLKPSENEQYKKLNTDSRKKQWLAARLCLKKALPEFDYEILYNKNRKPFLKPYICEISLSHTSTYAVAIINKTGNVGIDIEKISSRFEKIAPRFIDSDILSSIGDVYRYETMCSIWTIKESLFKFSGMTDLNLLENLKISPFTYSNNGFVVEGAVIKSGITQKTLIRVLKINDHILSYTI